MRSLAIVLVVALVVSSLALVHTRHLERVRFVELQKLQQEKDQLNIQWRQLQVEKRTYTEHGRIEKLARDRLGMTVPPAQDLVIVTQLDRAEVTQ